MNKDEQYNKISADAKEDPSVIGFILTGGRAKGFFNENSDYDVMIVLNDEAGEDVKKKYLEYKMPNDLEVFVFSLSEFKKYAEFGSDFAWDRYNFAHIKAQIDKTGEIQKLIDEKGTLPNDKINKVVSYNLGAYINFYYRSFKNEREGNKIAQRLAAAESIPMLLTATFALEGRIRPYNKYLEWELENYPLTKLPFTPKEFIEKILDIISTGNIKTQKEFFAKFRKIFYENGYNEEIDSWEGKV